MTLEQIVNRSSKTFGIDPALIWAIIKQESNFDSVAIGTSGEQGLMQLMKATAIEMGWDQKTPLNDELLNVTLGTKYLKWCQDYANKKGYNDLRDVISLYNAGPGNFDNYYPKRTKEKPYLNMAYVNGVYSYYKTLKGVNDLNRDLAWSLPIGLGLIGLALFLDRFQVKDK